MNTNRKAASVQKLQVPRPAVSSTIEGSGHQLRREAALTRRRAETTDRVAGVGLLENRLALPVREVADLLGISSAAVRLMIARGELPGRKIGGGSERVTYIVPTGALLSWLEGTSQGATEGAA